MDVKEKIIILKTQKFKESDLLVYGLNHEGLCHSYIAKSALKSKKRFVGGVLEPTHYVEVTYRGSQSKKDKGGIFSIKEAFLVEGFDSIRSDYTRLNLAFYFINIVYKVSQNGGVDSQGVFNLLGNSLRCLKTTKDLGKLKILFLFKFLKEQGVLYNNLKLPVFEGKNIFNHNLLTLNLSEQDQIFFKLQTSLRDYLGCEISC